MSVLNTIHLIACAVALITSYKVAFHDKRPPGKVWDFWATTMVTSAGVFIVLGLWLFIGLAI